MKPKLTECPFCGGKVEDDKCLRCEMQDFLVIPDDKCWKAPERRLKRKS